MGPPLQITWQECEPKKMLTLSARMWACNVSAILKWFPCRNLLDNFLDFHVRYPLSIGEETFGWGSMSVVSGKKDMLQYWTPASRSFAPVPLPSLSQLPLYALLLWLPLYFGPRFLWWLHFVIRSAAKHSSESDKGCGGWNSKEAAEGCWLSLPALLEMQLLAPQGFLQLLSSPCSRARGRAARFGTSGSQLWAIVFSPHVNSG